jgi:hypothetical protein
VLDRRRFERGVVEIGEGLAVARERVSARNVQQRTRFYFGARSLFLARAKQRAAPHTRCRDCCFCKQTTTFRFGRLLCVRSVWVGGGVCAMEKRL